MVRKPLSSPQSPPSPHISDLWRAQGPYTEQNIHSDPSTHPWVTEITRNGLLSRLTYFFQSPTGDHVWATHPFCAGGVGLGMTQVSHLGLSDSYCPTIFQGFPSLTNPQNLVSLETWRVLESLFLLISPCSVIFHTYHAVSELGLVGKKTGWDGEDWWEGG